MSLLNRVLENLSQVQESYSQDLQETCRAIFNRVIASVKLEMSGTVVKHILFSRHIALYCKTLAKLTEPCTCTFLQQGCTSGIAT